MTRRAPLVRPLRAGHRPRWRRTPTAREPSSKPFRPEQRHGKSIRHQMGGSFPSARPLFGLLGIPEDLLTDYAFRRFVQVFIKGALDLEELWPESLVDERGGCSQNDG